MVEKNWLAIAAHYIILAGAVWFAFGWLMTSDYQFSEPILFIILLIVIIVVDMSEHYVMEKKGWD